MSNQFFYGKIFIFVEIFSLRDTIWKQYLTFYCSLVLKIYFQYLMHLKWFLDCFSILFQWFDFESISCSEEKNNNLSILFINWHAYIMKTYHWIQWTFFSSILVNNNNSIVGTVCWIAKRNGRLVSCLESRIVARILWAWIDWCTGFFGKSSSLVRENLTNCYSFGKFPKLQTFA